MSKVDKTQDLMSLQITPQEASRRMRKIFDGKTGSISAYGISKVMRMECRHHMVPTEMLTLGLDLEHVGFDWKPYENRTPEARIDYNRLVVSMFHCGIQKPVIVASFKGNLHVLIGQRRGEIGPKIKYHQKPFLIIEEDVTFWTRADLDRLDILRKEIGHEAY